MTALKFHSIRDSKRTAAHPGAAMPRTAGCGPDDFQTEDYGTDVLAPYLPPGCHVWECAAGQGRMAARLEHHGFRVTQSDIKTGTDFLDRLSFAPSPRKWDVVVTNPPYSIKDDFLRRCLEAPQPFALLLPVTAIGEIERGRMWRQYGGIDVILPRRRILFTTPSGKSGGGWFFTAWFCRGLDIPQAGRICLA